MCQNTSECQDSNKLSKKSLVPRELVEAIGGDAANYTDTDK
jgi:hypothetical protein